MSTRTVEFELATPGVGARGEVVRVPLGVAAPPPPGAEPDLGGEHMLLNIGPQHPATHGVLRLVVELDGETVVRVIPHIGYLHSGFEKLGEYRQYNQIIPLTDRTDYLAPMANNVGFALAAGTTANTVNERHAVDNLEAAVAPINRAETSAASAIQACNQNLTCVTRIDAHLATVYNSFASTVVSIPVPTSGESAEEVTIAGDATKLAGVYAQLGNAKTADQYVSIANSSGVTSIASKLGNDFDRLLTNLGATLES